MDDTIPEVNVPSVWIEPSKLPTETISSTDPIAIQKFSVVMSLDPGGTTGVAIRVILPENKVIYHTAALAQRRQLYDLFKSQSIDVVICERFATSGHISKYGLHTTELVGAVEAICYVKNIVFVRHQPFNRKPFLEKAKALLKEHNKGALIHERDALAHLLAWEYKEEQALMKQVETKTYVPAAMLTPQHDRELQ